MDSNSDVEIEIDSTYVGTRVAFMHYNVAFYGTVKRCFVGTRKAMNWHIVYDNGDEEEILLAVLYQRQKLYAKEGKYDTIGNQNQPAIERPQPSPSSTTKKDNNKKKKAPTCKKEE